MLWSVLIDSLQRQMAVHAANLISLCTLCTELWNLPRCMSTFPLILDDLFHTGVVKRSAMLFLK